MTDSKEGRCVSKWI